MNRLICTMVAVVVAAGFQAQAFAGEQQERMKNCNAEAKDKALKGDERKAFMKECLSAKKEEPAAKTEAAPATPTQREKMKACNAEAAAKSLKGEERKAFMKGCLSADKA